MSQKFSFWTSKLEACCFDNELALQINSILDNDALFLHVSRNALTIFGEVFYFNFVNNIRVSIHLDIKVVKVSVV